MAGGLVSVTLIVTMLVLGPWVSLGVQLISPAAETVRLLGPETSAKVSGLAGRSGSVAVAVRLSAVSSVIVWFAGNVSTGGWFDSFTTIVNVLKSSKLGVPSSLSRIVIVLVPGPCA